MQIMYCDESNLEERLGDFLIYGGVIVPAANSHALSQAISTLRAEAGIAKDAQVKFNPPVEPLDHHGYRDFKQALIMAAIEHGCRFLGYAVLHDLARNPDVARRFGVNTLCWHFHCALNRIDQPGLVLIDRFNDAGNEIDGHLRDKMNNGVFLPHRGHVELSRIVGFHYSVIGQAHFTSLSDILVGSLRWAVNVHCRGQAEFRNSAIALLNLMSPLFWREEGAEQVPDIGFCLSPFSVRVRHFHDRYVGLQNFMREAGIPLSQIIETGT